MSKLQGPRALALCYKRQPTPSRTVHLIGWNLQEDKHVPAHLTFLAVLAFIASADTLTLRNGTTLRGQYVGGDARHIRMAVDDRVETVNIDEVSTLEFGPSQRSRRDGDRDRDNDAPPPPYPIPTATPPPARYSSVPELPSGTQIVVRMIDDVDSERDRTGKDFHASVDEPVLVNGQVLIPRGADVVARLVEDRQSGKFEGRTVLTIDLVQVQVNGPHGGYQHYGCFPILGLPRRTDR